MNKNIDNQSIVVGLDLGSTKAVIAVAKASQGNIEILGVGKSRKPIFKKGALVNIESTTEAIESARDEAELMAGVTLSSIWVGVGDQSVESMDSTGMIPITNGEIQKEDVAQVIEVAKAVPVGSGRVVLHVIPKVFKVDDQEGIKDPIGMNGVRMEVTVHVITVNDSFLQNIAKCTERAGLTIAGFVLQSLASSYALLKEEERKLGVAVVDIGGGSSDVIVYQGAGISSLGVTPVGGNHFTHDVALGLKTTHDYAEKLKIHRGCALADLVTEAETLEVEGVGDKQVRTVSCRDLCGILEARTEETLELILRNLRFQGSVTHLGSGVVLTGGGSQFKGLLEVASFIWDVPVRRGQLPDSIVGIREVVKDPSYSTVLGLLIYGWEQKAKSETSVRVEMMQTLHRWTDKVKTLLNKSLSNP